jgi:hypothetical protein
MDARIVSRIHNPILGDLSVIRNYAKCTNIDGPEHFLVIVFPGIATLARLLHWGVNAA